MGSKNRTTCLHKEAKRLKAVRYYNILDSNNEEELDNVTDLASKILDVPIALITIIDEDRVFG